MTSIALCQLYRPSQTTMTIAAKTSRYHDEDVQRTAFAGSGAGNRSPPFPTTKAATIPTSNGPMLTVDPGLAGRPVGATRTAPRPP